MAKRYFNWKLAIVLVIGLVVLGATAFTLRQWRRNTRAEKALLLGQKAYDESKWKESAENLGGYLALHQDDVQVLLKYADSQLKIRPTKPSNIQQAIAAYRSVLRIDSNNSEAVKQLVQIYLAIGTPGEAELIAKRYLEANKDPDIQRMFAIALVNQRKFSEAAEQLKIIIDEHPDQVLAYATLGRLTEQRPQEFTEPPLFWFDQAVQKNPSSALAYIIRAGFFLSNDDKPKALDDLQQAEKQDLSDPQVRLQLAREFNNADLLDKAELHLNTVQKATPTDQMLWRIWAEHAMRSQSQEKMLKIAETALQELASEPWDFMPTAVELFIRSGKLDRANDCVAKMRQKDIYPAVVAFFEGLIANQKGLTDEAIKSWYRAIELGDNSIRTRLLLTSDLSRLGDTQSALRLLRSLVSDFPDSIVARLALTKLLAQTGNWRETAEHATVALQLSPENVEAALLSIQAQIQLLDPNSAAIIQRAQDINQQLDELKTATDEELRVKILQFQLAMHQRDFEKARDLVTQLKSRYASQLRAVIPEVELLIAEEKEDQAISLLEKIRQQFPGAVEPVRYLAVLLEQKGDHEQCEIVIKNALDRIPHPLAQRDLSLLLADLYTRWQQHDKAFNLLNELDLKIPNSILIKRRFLICQQIIDNPERAQQLVDQIKSLEGDQGWQWKYEQARVWFNADNFKEYYPQIVSLMQENLLANPNDQTSRLLLAATYDRAGELQLAISTYHDALSRNPNDIRIIIPTVAALYKGREYDEAEEILNRASQQELYHPQLQRLQLQSYVRRREFGSAADVLQDILNDDPNNRAVSLSLALMNIQQNRFAEAEKLLNELKNQDPNSLPVTSAQIQLNIRQGKTDESIQLCDDLVKNLNDIYAYILRARTYAMLGQPEKAIEDFNQAVLMDYNSRIEPWVARSDFYRATNRPLDAIYDIQQALSIQPNNIQIQKRAISLFLASGDPAKIAKARVVLDEALKSNPEDISLQLFKARLLIAELTGPAIESAQQLLEKITQSHPDTVDAWVLLGQILLRQGQPGKAIDAALRGLAHKPNDKTLLILKADAESESSPILSIPTLKLLRELDPNDVDIAIKLANTYIGTGEHKKAVTLLKEQLDVCNASNIRKCKLSLAFALYKSGDKDSAKSEFDSLGESEPNDPLPLIAQARLLRDDKLWSILNQKVEDWCQNHPKDNRTPIIIAREVVATRDPQAQKTAENILRMVLDQHPDFSPALMSLAMVLQDQGRSDDAAKLYQQIIDVEPYNVIAINNLAWALCEQQGKYQQALELAERGLEIAPDYIDLIDTRGVIYYHLGQYEKAIQDFTDCIRLYPSNVPPVVATQFHLAKVYAQLEQRDSAIKYLNQVLDLENRIGGLSSEELAEAKSLLEKLKRGD